MIKIFIFTLIQIIKNINSSETLKFDFIQSSFGSVEKGICYLKRPYYLKCIYSDKKQKQIIEKLKENNIDCIPLELRHDRLLAGGFHCASLYLLRHD